MQSPLDDALVEIIEKMEELEKTQKQENVIECKKKDQDVANAQEMRERMLESFAETQKRNKDAENQQKLRKTSSLILMSLMYKKQNLE